MKKVTGFIGLCVALVLTGCSTEQNARKIVELNTNGGKVELKLMGSNAQLVSAGKISAFKEISAPDGTKIAVWIIKARDENGQPIPPKATVLAIHGLRKSKGSYPIFGIGQRLAKKGYDVVLPDLRAHGRSGGKYITWGAKESRDVRAVMDELIKSREINDKIFVFGWDLGASVGVQYAADDPRCKGVVAVTPFKDAECVARRLLWGNLMDEEEFQKTLDVAGEMADFDPDDASTVKAAKKLKCPLLVVHALIDVSVPLEHSDAVYKAAPEPKKFMVPTLETIIIAGILEDWIASLVIDVAEGKIKELSANGKISAEPAEPKKEPAKNPARKKTPPNPKNPATKPAKK